MKRLNSTEPDSFRIADKAAAHGVYKRTNTISAAADADVIPSAESAAESSDTPEQPYAIYKEDIIDSLDIIPHIRASAIPVFPRPAGVSRTDVYFPMISAKLMLSVCAVYPSDPKFTAIHIMTEAANITVDALCINSPTFSDEYSTAFFREGIR